MADLEELHENNTGKESNITHMLKQTELFSVFHNFCGKAVNKLSGDTLNLLLLSGVELICLTGKQIKSLMFSSISRKMEYLNMSFFIKLGYHG